MPIFIYSKVKPLRQTRGLKQSEIAAELGVSRPTYVLIENGGKEPTLSQLYTLARLLGVSAGELCVNLPEADSNVADYQKFKDLLSACAQAGANNGVITKSKLSALTYLTDFGWYRKYLRPMTGESYRCAARGPVADDFFRALNELYEDQAISLEPKGTSLVIQIIEQRPASLLKQSELELAERICEKWRGESTESIVNFTLSQPPCKSAKQGDLIAYEAALDIPEHEVF